MQKAEKMEITRPQENVYARGGKRAVDVALSALMLLVLSPVLLVLLAVAAWDTKGSPLFRQERIGRFNRPFVMYKIRTMKVTAPASMPTWQLSDPHRYMSCIGRLMRKCSLDELPQLWNVLRGDMSLIGPRPVVAEDAQLVRLRTRNGANTVRPGVTGLAQISGRDEVSIPNKARMDAEYARNVSLRMDLKIMLKTVLCVFSSHGVREGATEENAADTRRSA